MEPTPKTSIFLNYKKSLGRLSFSAMILQSKFRATRLFFPDLATDMALVFASSAPLQWQTMELTPRKSFPLFSLIQNWKISALSKRHRIKDKNFSNFLCPGVMKEVLYCSECKKLLK